MRINKSCPTNSLPIGRVNFDEMIVCTTQQRTEPATHSHNECNYWSLARRFFGAAFSTGLRLLFRLCYCSQSQVYTLSRLTIEPQLKVYSNIWNHNKFQCLPSITWRSLVSRAPVCILFFIRFASDGEMGENATAGFCSIDLVERLQIINR